MLGGQYNDACKSDAGSEKRNVFFWTKLPKRNPAGLQRGPFDGVIQWIKSG
jgi:hypothetical protein